MRMRMHMDMDMCMHMHMHIQRGLLARVETDRHVGSWLEWRKTDRRHS